MLINSLSLSARCSNLLSIYSYIFLHSIRDNCFPPLDDHLNHTLPVPKQYCVSFGYQLSSLYSFPPTQY